MNAPPVPKPRLQPTLGDSSVSVTWGAVAVLVLFVLTATISLYNTHQLHSDALWVAHTQDVVDALAEFERGVWEAQSRQWDELEEMAPEGPRSHHALVAQLRETSATIVELTRDNPAQQARAVELAQRIEPFAVMLEQVANTGRTQGFAAARRLATSDEMRTRREQIETLTGELEKHERDLLTRRKASNDRAYSIAVATGVLAGGVGLAAICLYLWLLRSHLQTRAEASSAIDAQRQFLQATLTGIGDGVVVTDEQCRVTFLNPVAEELTGWKQAEARGRPLEEVFHIIDEAGRRQVNNPARRALAEGCVIGLANHTLLISKGGEENSIDDSASPIRGQDGDITGTVLVFRDVTEQRASAAALRENERRKDEFLAMLGHELRNPLAGIVTGVQVLEMLNLGGDAGEMAAIIARQAAHMARIVDDLLDVSRIARSKLSLKQAPLELGDLLATIIRDYQSSHIIESCEISLAPPAFQACVDGDRTRLAQVVTNLLHNSCKFCDGPNTVDVSMVRVPGAQEVEIVVRDRGIGMTCETLQRIFEPFNQADNSLERSRGGLGLGLALVKGVVELHGGRVRVESPGLGQGTTFTITLPVVVCPQQTTAEPAKLESQGRKVLLIDDRRDAIWPVQKFLEMEGHVVIIANDGPQGLAKADEFRPEIILCDIGLAGSMNGYEVAQKLRASELKSTYLVAVTGYGQEEDRRTAQAAGFDFHLTKPVSRELLYEVIAKMPRF